MAEQKLPEEDRNNNLLEKSKETWQSLGSVIPFKPKKTTQSKEKAQPVRRHMQLVKLAGVLTEQTREEAGALGFMSRLLIMVNLPYRNPGKDCKNWYRKNGGVSIDIVPAYKDGECLGMPYGTYPRLILAYIVTQAVKTQSPKILLGKSFGAFLKSLKIHDGGKQYKLIRKQLERMLSASFSWTYKNNEKETRINIHVSQKSELWWNNKKQEQDDLWKSNIHLNHHFFIEIIRNAVPLDLRTLATLKNSPLGLDLYMFIAWRTFNLEKEVFISWEGLQQQLGGQYADLKVFARDCRHHIRRIQSLQTGINIKIVRGRLCLGPVNSNKGAS